MCAGTELLFLPCGIGCMPNRLVSGCGGFVKIQFFILYHRIPHIDRSSARAFYLRFLCPFGWLQELLHKVPTKKLSTKKLKPLTYIKYAVLLFAVGLLPMLITNDVGMGDPFSVSIFVLKEYSRGQSLFPLSIRESVPHWVRSFRGSWAY